MVRRTRSSSAGARIAFAARAFAAHASHASRASAVHAFAVHAASAASNSSPLQTNQTVPSSTFPNEVGGVDDGYGAVRNDDKRLEEVACPVQETS